MFSTTDIFDIAIQIEKNGQAAYLDAGTKTVTTKLAEMFQWMAEQEKSHAIFFDRLKNELPKVEVDAEMEAMGRMLLQEVLKERTFSLDADQLSKIDNLNEFLAVSIQFEKDTILFYKMLQTFIDDHDVLAHIQDVISEELRHVSRLEEFLNDTKSRNAASSSTFADAQEGVFSAGR